MVTYIEFGDIFNINNNIKSYAHGCNCAGAMGKGIALQFREKFPEMYLLYKEKCKNKKFDLGDTFIYKKEDVTIFNLGTQKTWRTKADLKAIEKSIATMLQYAVRNKVNGIALPKIGAGLGRLNWSDVKKIINKVSEKYPEIDLFIVENYKK